MVMRKKIILISFSLLFVGGVLFVGTLFLKNVQPVPARAETPVSCVPANNCLPDSTSTCCEGSMKKYTNTCTSHFMCVGVAKTVLPADISPPISVVKPPHEGEGSDGHVSDSGMITAFGVATSSTSASVSLSLDSSNMRHTESGCTNLVLKINWGNVPESEKGNYKLKVYGGNNGSESTWVCEYDSEGLSNPCDHSSWFKEGNFNLKVVPYGKVRKFELYKKTESGDEVVATTAPEDQDLFRCKKGEGIVCSTDNECEAGLKCINAEFGIKKCLKVPPLELYVKSDTGSTGCSFLPLVRDKNHPSDSLSQSLIDDYELEDRIRISYLAKDKEGIASFSTLCSKRWGSLGKSNCGNNFYKGEGGEYEDAVKKEDVSSGEQVKFILDYLPIKSHKYVTLGETDYKLCAVSGCTPGEKKDRGDANNDCKIDKDDFKIWKRNYMSGYNKDADFNSDGKVDLVDFEIWRSNYPFNDNE